MHFKFRNMVTAGCVAVLALSLPASIEAAPKKIDKNRAQLHRADQQHKNARHVVSPREKAKLAREEHANRLVSTRIAETPKRPVLGWPALVSEARKYMGTNPTSRTRLWCATFMNLVLAKVGYAGTNSDAAKSFAQYGRRISQPEIGAIAVLTRGRNGGHVGVVSGIDKQGNPIIISGNHGRRVGEAIYPRSRVIAYVMPSGNGPSTTQLAARTQPSRVSEPHRAPSGPGLESPITELLAAIEAEQRRPERPNARVAHVQQARAEARAPEPRRAASSPPAEAHRAVQQMPEQTTVHTQNGRRVLPIDPRLAEFLGITDRRVPGASGLR